jgi:hypothetical protein
MQNLVITPSWSTSLPTGWTQSSDEDCVTLTGPNAIGVLQISSFRKNELVSDQDLLDFAEDHLDAGAKPANEAFGAYTGFSIEFSVDDSFWQQWYLRQSGQMLFITYNCPIESRGIESQAITQVLSCLASRVGT